MKIVGLDAFRKAGAAGVAMVYLATHVVFCHSAEAEFWTARRAAARKLNGHGTVSGGSRSGASVPTDALVLAQLPGGARFDVHSPAPAYVTPVPAKEHLVGGKVPVFSSDLPRWLGDVVTPFGNIRDVHLSKRPGAPLVIHIQDLHDSTEAQRNIAGLVESLQDERGISLVGLEGAQGVFATEAFRAFPDAEITKAVADHFMEEGYLGGPEFAGITARRAPLLWGVEDMAGYNANVTAVKESANIRPAMELFLREARTLLDEIKTRRLSPALLEFDRNFSAYQSRKMPLGAYVRYLLKSDTTQVPHPPLRGTFPQEGKENKDFPSPLGRGQGEGPEQKQKSSLSGAARVPNLVLLRDALTWEDSLDFPRVERERAILLERLVGVMPKHQLNQLVDKSALYRLGRISYGDYYRFFRTLCDENGVALTEYRQLHAYVRYVLLAERINRNDLLNELSALELDVQDRLTATALERRVVNAARHLGQMERLVRHSYTPADWGYHLLHEDEIRNVGLTVRALAKEEGLPETLSPPSAEMLKPFENFCLQALGRNGAMVSRLLEKMSAEKRPAAVLVAGGFHTDGMMQLLRQKDVSYVVVTPKINGDLPDGHRSLDILARDPAPLEKLFAGDTVNIPTPRIAASSNAGYSFTAKAVGLFAALVLALNVFSTGAPARLTQPLPGVVAAQAEIVAKGSVQVKVEEKAGLPINQLLVSYATGQETEQSVVASVPGYGKFVVERKSSAWNRFTAGLLVNSFVVWARQNGKIIAASFFGFIGTLTPEVANAAVALSSGAVPLFTPGVLISFVFLLIPVVLYLIRQQNHRAEHEVLGSYNHFLDQGYSEKAIVKIVLFVRSITSIEDNKKGPLINQLIGSVRGVEVEDLDKALVMLGNIDSIKLVEDGQYYLAAALWAVRNKKREISEVPEGVDKFIGRLKQGKPREGPDEWRGRLGQLITENSNNLGNLSRAHGDMNLISALNDAYKAMGGLDRPGEVSGDLLVQPENGDIPTPFRELWNTLALVVAQEGGYLDPGAGGDEFGVNMVGSDASDRYRRVVERFNTVMSDRYDFFTVSLTKGSNENDLVKELKSLTVPHWLVRHGNEYVVVVDRKFSDSGYEKFINNKLAGLAKISSRDVTRTGLGPFTISMGGFSINTLLGALDTVKAPNGDENNNWVDNPNALAEVAGWAANDALGASKNISRNRYLEAASGDEIISNDHAKSFTHGKLKRVITKQSGSADKETGRPDWLLSQNEFRNEVEGMDGTFYFVEATRYTKESYSKFIVAKAKNIFAGLGDRYPWLFRFVPEAYFRQEEKRVAVRAFHTLKGSDDVLGDKVRDGFRFTILKWFTGNQNQDDLSSIRLPDGVKISNFGPDNLIIFVPNNANQPNIAKESLDSLSSNFTNELQSIEGMAGKGEISPHLSILKVASSDITKKGEGYQVLEDLEGIFVASSRIVGLVGQRSNNLVNELNTVAEAELRGHNVLLLTYNKKKEQAFTAKKREVEKAKAQKALGTLRSRIQPYFSSALWTGLVAGVERIFGLKRGSTLRRYMSGGRYFYAFVIPLVELVIFPGMMLLANPLGVSIGILIPISALIATLMHGLPYLGRGPPPKRYYQSLDQFVGRLFGSGFVFLVAAFFGVGFDSSFAESLSVESLLATSSLNLRVLPSLIGAYFSHAVYNFVVPEQYRLSLADGQEGKRLRKVRANRNLALTKIDRTIRDISGDDHSLYRLLTSFAHHNEGADKSELELLAKLFRAVVSSGQPGSVTYAQPLAVSVAEWGGDKTTILTALIGGLSVAQGLSVIPQETFQKFGITSGTEDINKMFKRVLSAGRLPFSVQKLSVSQIRNQMGLVLTGGLINGENDDQAFLLMLMGKVVLMRQAKESEEKKKLAKELEFLYAPLAERFGQDALATEILDQAFLMNSPELFALRHSDFQRATGLKHGPAQEALEDLRAHLEARLLDTLGPKYEGLKVLARVKGLASVNEKILRDSADVGSFNDLFGITIIFPQGKNREDDIVNDLLKEYGTALPEKTGINTPLTKDYEFFRTIIKENRTLSPEGKAQTFEVQVYDYDTWTKSKTGEAAHWLYNLQKRLGHQTAQVDALKISGDLAKDLLDFINDEERKKFVYITVRIGENEFVPLRLPHNAIPADAAAHRRVGLLTKDYNGMGYLSNEDGHPENWEFNELQENDHLQAGMILSSAPTDSESTTGVHVNKVLPIVDNATRPRTVLMAEVSVKWEPPLETIKLLASEGRKCVRAKLASVGEGLEQLDGLLNDPDDGMLFRLIKKIRGYFYNGGGVPEGVELNLLSPLAREWGLLGPEEVFAYLAVLNRNTPTFNNAMDLIVSRLTEDHLNAEFKTNNQGDVTVLVHGKYDRPGLEQAVIRALVKLGFGVEGTTEILEENGFRFGVNLREKATKITLKRQTDALAAIRQIPDIPQAGPTVDLRVEIQGAFDASLPSRVRGVIALAGISLKEFQSGDSHVRMIVSVPKGAQDTVADILQKKFPSNAVTIELIGHPVGRNGYSLGSWVGNEFYSKYVAWWLETPGLLAGLLYFQDPLAALLGGAGIVWVLYPVLFVAGHIFNPAAFKGKAVWELAGWKSLIGFAAFVLDPSGLTSVFLFLAISGITFRHMQLNLRSASPGQDNIKPWLPQKTLFNFGSISILLVLGLTLGVALTTFPLDVLATEVVTGGAPFALGSGVNSTLLAAASAFALAIKLVNTLGEMEVGLKGTGNGIEGAAFGKSMLFQPDVFSGVIYPRYKVDKEQVIEQQGRVEKAFGSITGLNSAYPEGNRRAALKEKVNARVGRIKENAQAMVADELDLAIGAETDEIEKTKLKHLKGQLIASLGESHRLHEQFIKAEIKKMEDIAPRIWRIVTGNDQVIEFPKSFESDGTDNGNRLSALHIQINDALFMTGKKEVKKGRSAVSVLHQLQVELNQTIESMKEESDPKNMKQIYQAAQEFQQTLMTMISFLNPDIIFGSQTLAKIRFGSALKALNEIERAHRGTGKSYLEMLETSVPTLVDGGREVASAINLLTDSYLNSSGLNSEARAHVEELKNAIQRSIENPDLKLDHPLAGKDVVVVSKEPLNPFDILELERWGVRIKAIVMLNGTQAMHGAIAAKSSGYLCVTDLKADVKFLWDSLTAGEDVAVFSEDGEVVFRPSPATKEKVSQLNRRAEVLKGVYFKARNVLNRVVALLASPDDYKSAQESADQGALGAGLFRTEHIYAAAGTGDVPALYDATGAPNSELEAFLVRELIRHAKLFENKPFAGRLLDFTPDAKDKTVTFVPPPKLRGAEFILSDQGRPFARQEIRAFMKAYLQSSNIQLFFPMVSTAEQARDLRQMVEDVMNEFSDGEKEKLKSMKIGAMAETTESVDNIGSLLENFDFINIGTKDLTLDSFGKSSSDPAVSGLLNQLNKKVIEQIVKVLEAAKEAGKPVTACGVLAGNEIFIPVAIILARKYGMQLSVPPSEVAKWNYWIPLIEKKTEDLRILESYMASNEDTTKAMTELSLKVIEEVKKSILDSAEYKLEYEKKYGDKIKNQGKLVEQVVKLIPDLKNAEGFTIKIVKGSEQPPVIDVRAVQGTLSSRIKGKVEVSISNEQIQRWAGEFELPNINYVKAQVHTAILEALVRHLTLKNDKSNDARIDEFGDNIGLTEEAVRNMVKAGGRPEDIMRLQQARYDVLLETHLDVKLEISADQLFPLPGFAAGLACQIVEGRMVNEVGHYEDVNKLVGLIATLKAGNPSGNGNGDRLFETVEPRLNANKDLEDFRPNPLALALHEQFKTEGNVETARKGLVNAILEKIDNRTKINTMTKDGSTKLWKSVALLVGLNGSLSEGEKNSPFIYRTRRWFQALDVRILLNLSYMVSENNEIGSTAGPDVAQEGVDGFNQVMTMAGALRDPHQALTETFAKGEDILVYLSPNMAKGLKGKLTPAEKTQIGMITLLSQRLTNSEDFEAAAWKEKKKRIVFAVVGGRADAENLDVSKNNMVGGLIKAGADVTGLSRASDFNQIKFEFTRFMPAESQTVINAKTEFDHLNITQVSLMALDVEGVTVDYSGVRDQIVSFILALAGGLMTQVAPGIVESLKKKRAVAISA